MSTPIISVEHLSKRYRLGQIGATTLRDSVQRFVDRLRGRGELSGCRVPELLRNSSQVSPSSTTQQPNNSTNNPNRASSATQQLSNPTTFAPSPSDFWALRDVSFEVQPGEVLGIIGRNGAGKSTLLKILSRITEPTSGRAIIRGRVASLLEVGTGFHPELSGRENIFLNGAILGMRHAEIARKFDEIVAFAEVDKFIDTPVKRYSSGMYVRLAFAVAAHLEPEILVIDEVLAVGDAQFQQKCLGKMGEVAKEGRTVLFVSHNMGAIEALCAKCVLLKNGLIDFVGDAKLSISRYLGETQNCAQESLMQRADRLGNGAIRIVDILLGINCDEECDYWRPGEDCFASFHYLVNDGDGMNKVDIGMVVEDCFGRKLFYANTIVSRTQMQIDRHSGFIICLIERLPLAAGQYFLSFDVYHQGQLLDKVNHAKIIRIEGRDGVDTWASWGGYGTICAKYSWRVRHVRKSN